MDVEERLICSAGSPAGPGGSSPRPGRSGWRNVPIAHSCSPRSASLPSFPDVPGSATPVPCVGSSLSWTWGWEGGPAPAAWDPPVPLLSPHCNPTRSWPLLTPERSFWSCGVYLSHTGRCLWSFPAPSPPSGGINCLKHFLDSRGGFCSLSPLFAFAWSQAPAGAANSGSPEGCPLPWSKDWGGSFPRAKNDLPRDAMTLPACPSAALHPPRAPPDVFIQGFYTCKPLTKRGLSPSPGRSDSLGYERLCSSPGLNTIPLCSKCPVHWGVLAEFGSILEHLKGLECIK